MFQVVLYNIETYFILESKLFICKGRNILNLLICAYFGLEATVNYHCLLGTLLANFQYYQLTLVYVEGTFSFHKNIYTGWRQIFFGKYWKLFFHKLRFFFLWAFIQKEHCYGHCILVTFNRLKWFTPRVKILKTTF